MKKGCELCAKPARMYCDSDQARLCWECDERVHCANFLVAKHTRSLLCHVCQSPTPWKASGAKLGPAISVCNGCSTNKGDQSSSRRDRIIQEDEETVMSSVSEDSDDGDEDHYSDSDYDYTGEEEDEADVACGDEENQVVPWSPTTIPLPSYSAAPPPLTTSSCSELEGSLSTRDGGEAVSSALKRFRCNPRLDSDDEDGCSCSSQYNSKTTAAEEVEEEAKGASFRAINFKMTRIEEEEEEEYDNNNCRRRRRRRRISR